MQVTPRKLERAEDDRIKVTFSDGTADVYDTVLSAVGRTADTAKLGLESVNVVTNPKNRKIVTTFEQSSCSNIYAVGDVMDGCPELTPVAIQAGVTLARRLLVVQRNPWIMLIFAPQYSRRSNTLVLAFLKKMRLESMVRMGLRFTIGNSYPLNGLSVRREIILTLLPKLWLKKYLETKRFLEYTTWVLMPVRLCRGMAYL